MPTPEAAAPPRLLPPGPAPAVRLVRGPAVPPLLLGCGLQGLLLLTAPLLVGLPVAFAALALAGLLLARMQAWLGDRPLLAWGAWVVTPLALWGLMAVAMTRPETAMVAPALGAAGAVAPLGLLRGAVRRRTGLRDGRRAAQAAVGLGVAAAAMGGAMVAGSGAEAWTMTAGAVAAALVPSSLSALQLLASADRKLAGAHRAGEWMQGLDRWHARVASAPWGLQGAATDGELRFTVELVDTTWPAWARVTVPVPGLDSAVTVRARAPGDAALPSPDPVLARLVAVSGAADPAALVADRHDVLLPVLQGHPGSEVSGGAVRLVYLLPEDAADPASADRVVQAALDLARALSRGCG